MFRRGQSEPNQSCVAWRAPDLWGSIFRVELSVAGTNTCQDQGFNTTLLVELPGHEIQITRTIKLRNNPQPANWEYDDLPQEREQTRVRGRSCASTKVTNRPYLPNRDKNIIAS